MMSGTLYNIFINFGSSPVLVSHSDQTSESFVYLLYIHNQARMLDEQWDDSTLSACLSFTGTISPSLVMISPAAAIVSRLGLYLFIHQSEELTDLCLIALVPRSEHTGPAVAPNVIHCKA